MQTKIICGKNLLALLAASSFLAVAGCSTTEAPVAAYRHQTFVMTDAQKADSNNYPDSSKPDVLAVCYVGYSEQTLPSTRLGSGPIIQESAFNHPATTGVSPSYGGYSGFYPGYGWSHSGAYDGYRGYGSGYGGYRGYRYSSYGYGGHLW